MQRLSPLLVLDMSSLYAVTLKVMLICFWITFNLFLDYFYKELLKSFSQKQVKNIIQDCDDYERIGLDDVNFGIIKKTGMS